MLELRWTARRMTFNEANTVEAFIRDRLCGGVTHHTAVGPASRVASARSPASAGTSSPRQNLPRQPHEVLVEDHVREALIRLNPEIAAQPDRADEVLYKLRAIVMGVRDGRPRQGERGVRRLAHRASGRCRSARTASTSPSA